MSSDPPAFDEALYLALNPDVAAAVKARRFSSGRQHFERFGEREGRRIAPGAPLTRSEKALFAVRRDGLGLEIGASHNPIAPKREGFRVQTVDQTDAAGLRAKYAGHEALGVNLANIEEVDFVWRGGCLAELIGRAGCYDWIIASHVIEHLPDPVSFLGQCETLLKDDGVLSLVVPDRRYCFDALGAASTTGQFLDAWAGRRTRPSPGQVFDHFANACRLGDSIAWTTGAAGDLRMAHSVADAAAQWRLAGSSAEYIDVHCWRFTPDSFRLVLSDLKALGLVTFGVKLAFDTAGCEFHVALAKGLPATLDDRLGALRGIAGAG